MAKTAGDYEIPFNAKGDQLHYAPPYGDLVWMPNTEFQDELTYETFSRGRSAAYFHFKRQNGTRVTVFMKEFDEMMPYMVAGVVKGTFKFVKRGTNYGCTLIKPSEA